MFARLSAVPNAAKRYLVMAAVVLLAGCGFQLRGNTSLPFSTLYVPASSSLGVELKRNIAAGTETNPNQVTMWIFCTFRPLALFL